MAKLSDNEYSVISFKAYREDKKVKSSLVKIIDYLIYEVMYGNQAKEFVLTLTNKNLYIDYIDQPGQSDVSFTEKIDRKNIKSYEVKKEANREIITLLKSKGKARIYIRDNENSSNLAAEMAKLIEQQHN